MVLSHIEKAFQFKDGRYWVSIPWKSEPHLPDNLEMASKRLAQTEKKIKKNPEIETRYSETIEKYIEKGYLRKVEKKEVQPDSKWYLPHFPIVDLNRETTKVRIVYDAAAKHHGLCINDFIHRGPKLQNDLFDILLRFRKHEIAVNCDISEMYLQVRLCESDRKYHRMLWDNSEYEFNRLLFGIITSPFLAKYVSQKNAQEYADIFQMAADTVLKSTYMDDSMEYVCSEEEGIRLYQQLSQLWKKSRNECENMAFKLYSSTQIVPKEDISKEVDLDKDTYQLQKPYV